MDEGKTIALGEFRREGDDRSKEGGKTQFSPLELV